MSSGKLIAAYAYEVSPQQSGPFTGGAILLSSPLQNALDQTFNKSKISQAPAVDFVIDTTVATRAHPIRDAAQSIAFSTRNSKKQSILAETLAQRLADSMDQRSKPSLLMISTHRSIQVSERRFLLWTFPQQEVFNLTSTGGTTELELLDAFNRESSLRKAALIEGSKGGTEMLTARVLDLQSTATERSVADLWISKFLAARLQMSSGEGTRILARSLRAAHTATRGNERAQDEINAAISALRVSKQRWSLQKISSKYFTREAASEFMKQTSSDEQVAVFDIDVPRFDAMIQYRRFTLSNGIIVSAPFIQDDGLNITEENGRRHLRAEGNIEDEQVRSRG